MLGAKNHPAVSIVGACTPQAFFEALTPIDIEGGFANRAMLLPFEGIRRPPERDVPAGADEPPKRLIEELKLLRPGVLDIPMSEVKQLGGKAEEVVVPPVDRKDRRIIGWGSDEAKAAYYEFSREIDQWEEKDKRKFELGMRAAENAVRCATNIAGGCGSPTVDLPDIQWALKWARVSFEAVDGGVKKYMRNYYEFPKFCEEVLEFISRDGFASTRDLHSTFRRNMYRGFELGNVLAQLVKEGRIERGERKKSRGPAASGYRVVE
jgi:hypothetical protein